MAFILGIDTGGTFTDGVIIDTSTGEIVCKAKALTTRDDLSMGIEACMDGLDIKDPAAISLVSISTTLATNATVEGRGGRAALVYMGGDAGRVPADHLVRVAGQLDISGHELERPDEADILRKIRPLKGRIEAAAVSGYASVRNQRHEKLVREVIRRELNIPVVCGYELTSALGFNHRSVTAVLNARLIPVIKDLFEAINEVKKARGIKAPIMAVRGDGTLMSCAKAMERPVETLMSGPAASVTGAMYLTGRRDAVVIDMGGTTMDIANIEDGKVRVRKEGARVGGWLTRVQAADISTFGLGGDSRIFLDERGGICVGPEKVVPVSLAADRFPNLTDEFHGFNSHGEIKKYYEHEAEGLMFVKEDGLEIDSRYRGLVEALRSRPHSISWAAAFTGELPESLDPADLVSRGVLARIGLTPTDLLHIRGSFTPYNRKAAAEAAKLLAARLGMPLERFVDAAASVIREKAALNCIQSIADFEREKFSFGESEEAMYILSRVFGSRKSALFTPAIKMDRPLIVIGAPAKAWLSTLDEMMDVEIIAPENADVANAAGAAAGKITVSAEVTVRVDGDGYSLSLPEETERYRDREEAMFYAVHLGRQHVEHGLMDAGCSRWEITEEHEDLWHDLGGGARDNIGTRIMITGVGLSMQAGLRG